MPRLRVSDSNLPIVTRVIRVTEDALRKRARLYRRLVITNVAVVFLAALAGIFVRAWLSAAAAIAVIPVTGSYVLLDTAIVREWQRIVLALWQKEAFPMNTILLGLRNYPFPMRETVEGMIQMLCDPHIDSSDGRGAFLKRAETELQRQQYRTAAGTLVVSALAATILLIALRYRHH